MSVDAVTSLLRGWADGSFWSGEATRRALLARLPAYRLSKFQLVMSEAMALEVIGSYLLDGDGAARFLAAWVR